VPAGAAITVGGNFTWTPTEAQGPNSYTFDVVVSDGLLSDSETITVTVTEGNVAPVLGAIGNQTVAEETLLTFTATATDHDIPAQTLTFSLGNGTSGAVPAGAAITSGGNFTWTPTEAQGPGNYTFDVVVSDGSLTDSETIEITVNSVYVDWDIDGNGCIDIFDLALVGLSWMQTGTPGWIREDVDNDGKVDIFDLAIVGLHWWEGCP
jgi:hypothetical protein